MTEDPLLSRFDRLISKFDYIITEAKDFLNESNQKKELIKEIELRTIEYVPLVQKKIDEIKNLLMDIPRELSDQEVALQLKEGLSQAELMMENVKLIVEADWAKEQLEHQPSLYTTEWRNRQLKYVTHTASRILEAIENTTNFGDLADFANQIWADYDLLEEFNRSFELVQALVRRMNATNLKKTTTHLDVHNVKKTLIHIREYLFKKNRWTETEVDEYHFDRQREIGGQDLMVPPVEGPYKILFFGMTIELIDRLKTLYFFSPQVKLDWVDLSQLATSKMPQLLSGCNLVVLVTNFLNHPAFGRLTQTARELQIPVVTDQTLEPDHIMKTIRKFWSTSAT